MDKNFTSKREGRTNISKSTKDNGTDKVSDRQPATQTESSSFDDEDWVIVGKEHLNEATDRIESIPTEHFKGTWNGAYQNTAKAAKDVGHASLSYVEALAHSGVAKAGYSIGAAIAITANRGALTATSLALNTAGINTYSLPYGMQSWLLEKDRMDETKRRVKEAEEARKVRKIKEQLIASGELVPAPSRLATRRSSLTGSSSDSPDDMSDNHWKHDPRTRRNDIGHNPNTPAGKTPYHVTAIKNAFETPAPVRQRLNKPLGIESRIKDEDSGFKPTPVFSASPSPVEELHDSPFATEGRTEINEEAYDEDDTLVGDHDAENEGADDKDEEVDAAADTMMSVLL